MAQDDLQIVIRSSGGEKVVASFKAISDGSAKMGTTVEQSAQKSGRSLEELKRQSAAVGTGLGVMVGAAALAGRAFVDQERSIASLRRTYGDATDDLVKFSDELQQSTTFSNDAARQAEAVFGTLARNYGLTSDQIIELTQRTADLAAATGFTLPDAAERVAAAIRGEAESAEALGLTMNQQAIDRDNLTLSMSNQEAAQFRLNALYEQSAFAEGAAAERADTLAGKTEQLVNRGQDMIQSFGGAIGPLGQVTSVLGDFALAAPLAGAGVGKLVTGVSALASVMGPAGLVLAAGAAAFAIYELAKGTDDYAEVADKARGSAASLATTLNQLAAAGSPNAAIGQSDLAVLQAAVSQMGDLKTAEEALAAAEERLDKARKSQGGDQAQREAAIAQLEQQVANTQRVVDALKDVPDAMQAIGDVLADTGTGAGLAQEALSKLFADFAKTGDIIALVEGLSALNDDLGKFDDQANKAATSTGGLQAALHGLPLEPAAGLIDRATGKLIGMGDAADDSAPKVDRLAEAIQRATDAMRPDVLDPQGEGSNARLAQDLQAIGDAAGQAGEIARAKTVQLGDQLADEVITLQEYRDAVHGIAKPFEELAKFAELFASNITTSLDDVGTALAESTRFMDQFAGEGMRLSEVQRTLTDNTEAAATAFRASESALDRMARGSTSAGVALAAFKEIQDGIIASQDPFNQQLSEYGQQLDYLQNAEDLLNQRKADGIALSKEEEDFLARVDAAQERVTGGKEDATIALGEQALAYAENMKLGDQLNSTLDGTNQAVGGLTSAIQLLTATMTVLGGTHVEPSVVLAGLDLAQLGLADVVDLLNQIDGREANAVVNILTGNTSGLTAAQVAAGLGSGSMHGGIAHHALGGMTRIIAGEAGYELLDFANGGQAIAATYGTYNVPVGTMVTPHPASVERLHGMGGVTLNVHVGEVNGLSGVDELVSEMTRLVSARFAGLGM